ncbi:conserved Plasmodium protein, unknown function [Plasmodium knowlesi strain H]|uniref:Uncharacterized protein n=3 Tax=Plasmodium knowlesi TaxID=5850 RepID=A0A5K1TXQ2_PLAKH|nr:conserved protein, unknown function [Plasmodium knowlesi strain H]OTN68662.1 Uncharacterized protein PKNOH_S01020300 [Plasmodium knowlesi]CAA9986200.1 conserved protein, unknown function [Plasmodium knowlesi strain H]SBO25403.1 conserved Plasmodium protein, unknown function [Plasmodium knowlesi strain H]SBO27693.1 conserved Plasmodium protein, unknown function [Plasmodium knowlesi strain H]VVS75674.1 conserved protein, unknown function [Plasmodium knowlesi strain H]|eukprot:XP_002257610.1 hypothetical protein, conserved in Plasmodium species [Plasmodium knowlesi strain H]
MPNRKKWKRAGWCSWGSVVGVAVLLLLMLCTVWGDALQVGKRQVQAKRGLTGRRTVWGKHNTGIVCTNCETKRPGCFLRPPVRSGKREKLSPQKNVLNSFERSVDKVTGNFLHDRDLFIEVDKKQKMIEEIEKMNQLQYEHIQKYIQPLSQNDVYEEIINHKIHLYKKENETEKLKKLIKVQEFLNPYIISQRKKKAKEKVEYMIACILKGENIDQIITEMFRKRLIDVYVLTFIDDKVMEAHTKLVRTAVDQVDQIQQVDQADQVDRVHGVKRLDGVNHHPHEESKHGELGGTDQMSITEKILRMLKDRIVAQQKLQVKGTFDFTRIVFLSTTLDISEDRQSIIKSSIRTIDQLEEFELYLLDALDYAETNEKMKQYIPHLELLLSTCKKMNPVFNQLLNKQTENVRFFPDKIDMSQFKEL